VSQPAHLPARRPPLLLLILLIASLSMSVLTAGHARDYTKSWNRVRSGKTILEQRLTLGRRAGWPTAIVPWFDRAFLVFADRLINTVPADANILIEPTSTEIHDDSGRARWFMYLNYAAYPLKFYVRAPQNAGGTLVDYVKWLGLHKKGKRTGHWLDEQLAIADREIDWKVKFAVTRDFAPESIKLLRREGGNWVEVPLATEPRKTESLETVPAESEEAGQ
jgi:hypothetical protein